MGPKLNRSNMVVILNSSKILRAASYPRMLNIRSDNNNFKNGDILTITNIIILLLKMLTKSTNKTTCARLHSVVNLLVRGIFRIPSNIYVGVLRK